MASSIVHLAITTELAKRMSFTKEMSDEFIEEAVKYCVEEVGKIRNGEQGIDKLTYAWNRG